MIEGYDKRSRRKKPKLPLNLNSRMTRVARLNVFVAILSIAFLSIAGTADALRQYGIPASYTTQRSRSTIEGNNLDMMNSIRGGSSAIDVDIESSDEEETDVEEEEETGSLGKSTKKAATKTVKKSVAAAMKSTQKTPRFSIGKFFKLPYILKACLNPLVFSKMISGYWKSLYNINYMSDNAADSSQDLRSALEQKARFGGGKKPSRGRRKMKPGQAKTLSDLPQLNT